MLRFSFTIILVGFLSLFVLTTGTFAAIIVFGEDGFDLDLTGSAAGNSWTSTDEFIIAGDCYVPDDATLTLGAGVTVKFDYDYDGDGTAYPEIEVKGIITCNGTSGSPVTFTNYLGTNKGEFKGLYLNGQVSGVDDYEGKLNGSYIRFFYGGSATGLIRVGEDGHLDIDHSIVRFSDNHGIYLDDTGGLVELDHCEIDTNDVDGVTWSEGENDNGTMRIKYSSFVGNGGYANRVPRRDDDYAEEGYNEFDHNYYCLNNQGFIGIFVVSFGEITNNYFYNCSGIYIGSEVYCPKFGVMQTKWKINNNVFCRSVTESIVQIWDVDYTFEGASKKVEMINNVFWNYGDFQHGLRFEDDDGSLGQGNEWPSEYLELERNIFGQIGDNSAHIKFDRLDNRVLIVPSSNAFESDDVTNVNISNCIIDGVDGATITLADENGTDDDPDSYDFHIRWDGNNSIINVDDSASDPDGSDADCGCYGGALGDKGIGDVEVGGNPGGINDQERVIGHFYDNCSYIDLGPGIDSDGTMVRSEYYMFSDFEIDAGDQVTIEDYAVIASQGDFNFEVYGKLIADATDRESDIEFLDGTANDTGWEGGDGWRGLYFRTGSSWESVLDYVEIKGTYSNFPGLQVRFVERGQNPNDKLSITNTNVHHCGVGIYIYNSEAKVTSCETSYNDYHSFYVVTCTVGKVEIVDLNTHHNFGNRTYSSGLRFNNADPEIGELNNSETQSSNNEKFGMHCDNSSPIMNDDEFDYYNVGFYNNGDSQIHLRDGSYPVFHFGDNNVDPNNENVYAVEFGTGQTSVWDARGTWWGTEDPDDDEDDLFSDPAKINYTDWEDGWIDSFEDFEAALRNINRNRFNEAIPYLERVVYDEDLGGHRISALRYLRGCYTQSDGDFDELLDFYHQVTVDFDAEIAYIAETQGIWTLADRGSFENAIEAFQARRRTLNNRADSLRNEMYLLTARLGVEDDDHADFIGNYENIDMWFDENLERLDNLLAEELENEAARSLIPSTIQLSIAYPNPFNSTTRISYELNDIMNVEVAVFNTLGQQIAVLDRGERAAGTYNLTWNADNVPSGIYFVKLNTSDFEQTRKILLVR
ncbi:MAG: T9SS type A sorting domain-containing protein [Candidatus Hatepunaea meridiana]|nr:T9SS type A sorting domain-containing protein [Candidatus Hatepunaea meridiana]